MTLICVEWYVARSGSDIYRSTRSICCGIEMLPASLIRKYTEPRVIGPTLGSWADSSLFSTAKAFSPRQSRRSSTIQQLSDIIDRSGFFRLAVISAFVPEVMNSFGDQNVKECDGWIVVHSPMVQRKIRWRFGVEITEESEETHVLMRAGSKMLEDPSQRKLLVRHYYVRVRYAVGVYSSEAHWDTPTVLKYTLPRKGTTVQCMCSRSDLENRLRSPFSIRLHL